MGKKKESAPTVVETVTYNVVTKTIPIRRRKTTRRVRQRVFGRSIQRLMRTRGQRLSTDGKDLLNDIATHTLSAMMAAAASIVRLKGQSTVMQRHFKLLTPALLWKADPAASNAIYTKVVQACDRVRKSRETKE